MAMVLDLMYVHNFNGQMVNGIYGLLLLVCTIVHQYIIIIGKRYPVFDKGPTDGSDDTTITAKAKYSVNITKSNKDNLFVSTLKFKLQVFVSLWCKSLYQFKAKDSEIKPWLLCFGNIWKDITVDDNIQKTGLNGKKYNISFEYKTIDISDIHVEINEYLMKKTQY